MMIFFLRIRRPPRSTLFPTRRSSDLETSRHRSRSEDDRKYSLYTACQKSFGSRRERSQSSQSRSEEHTSELQSQSNLVCRLLLEKKKNNTCNLMKTNWY